MGILDGIISEIKDTGMDEQIRTICEKIIEEEAEREGAELNKLFEPQGTNIFLSVEVPPRYKDEVTFTCLEREATRTYLISIWSGKPKTIQIETSEKIVKEPLKRVKVSKILGQEGNTVKGVMKEFARTVKYARGE